MNADEARRIADRVNEERKQLERAEAERILTTLKREAELKWRWEKDKVLYSIRDKAEEGHTVLVKRWPNNVYGRTVAKYVKRALYQLGYKLESSGSDSDTILKIWW